MSLRSGKRFVNGCRICRKLERNLPCVIGGNVVDVYIHIHAGAFLNFYSHANVTAASFVLSPCFQLCFVSVFGHQEGRIFQADL